MWEYNYTPSPDELYHFGVKGMKWGRRKVRGHAGPGRYATKKRQLAGDKKDLEALNKGQHLSAGVTKKRQAAYDARDRAALEKRITKNEKKVSSMSKSRYDRAVNEAASAKKLAGTYTNAMDRKVEKRKQAYEKKGSSMSKSRYDRAVDEAASARKLAGAYTNAMDKKVEKRKKR